ncbi:hypothetical protein AB5N19_11620 [Seiridium cardinale]|uniref:Uncharacterized protein n=1 Tax=Seiridium cardinale TaxID=138064 RepID=A0ABR2XV49_9PEZI
MSASELTALKLLFTQIDSSATYDQLAWDQRQAVIKYLEACKDVPIKNLERRKEDNVRRDPQSSILSGALDTPRAKFDSLQQTVIEGNESTEKLRKLREAHELLASKAEGQKSLHWLFTGDDDEVLTNDLTRQQGDMEIEELGRKLEGIMVAHGGLHADIDTPMNDAPE